MKTTNRQKRLTKKFEGLRLCAYPDLNGNMTIGYGHKLEKQSKVQKISIKDAQGIFNYDMNEVEKQVTAEELDLNQNQFDAICDFVFNIGIRRFENSTLIKMIRKDKNNIAIAKEFMKWIYVNKKVNDGLKHRREVEYLIYFTQDLFNK